MPPVRIPATVLSCLLATGASAQDFVFADNFEPVTALRLTDLDLRDPHVYVDAIVSCLDATDTPLLGFSLNASIQTQIETDADGDGLLDASFMQLFRPLATAGSGRVDVTSAACLAPQSATACVRDPGQPVQVRSCTTSATDTCLAPPAGSVRPYTPAVALPAPPCWRSDTQDTTLDLAGIAVPARAVTFAATFAGAPVTLQNGLISAFVREADADAALLPASLPLVGGRPLSSILPGGTGSCAAHDDRDLFEGESGWWFHLNYTAVTVPWSGG
ncbi:hypothetical protein [Dokdonella koreensis]|uniref:Secreted protein n=1 Tax=Dokdonella koreensis DS-123 TaxID=1300342 RepID=A0A160DXY5_9GAMM|nr:hypothetical protein [Dokdonella koreensis]ANB19201.1 Hypothetical protein I596_3212 [Dokdonella koreensis DS-123]